MLRYLRRARALAHTVDRLEGEVRELKASLRELQGGLEDVEERTGRVAERARLETLAAERRMQLHLEQVEKAATGIFDHLRSTRAGAGAQTSVDRERR